MVGMRVLSVATGAMFFFLVLGHVFAQEVSCEGRKADLLAFLQEGTASVRRRIEEVQGNIVLSEGTRGDFQQSAEWLIAWMRDQAERLKGFADCADLSKLANDTKSQIMPVYLASLRAHAAVILWEIDRIELELRTSPPGPSDVLQKFGEAEAAFRAIQEGTPTFGEARAAMRRAIFLTRQGYRLMRTHGILE